MPRTTPRTAAVRVTTRTCEGRSSRKAAGTVRKSSKALTTVVCELLPRGTPGWCLAGNASRDLCRRTHSPFSVHSAPKYNFDTDLRNPTFNLDCYNSNFHRIMTEELRWSGTADSGAAARTHTKRKLWSKAMADNINLVAWPSGTWATNCPNAASTAAACTAGTPCTALCTVLASHGNSCGAPPPPPPKGSPAPAPSGGKRL